MHNLVPHFILENFARDIRRGEFPAAGLFVDISGFTKMTETLMTHGPHGAEVLAGIMRRVFKPLIQSVYEQGGFITGLAGDAFTALFPIEDGQVDGYLQTLTSAWQVQQAITNLAAHKTPYGEFPISAKVGLGSGEAIWGIVTSEDEKRAAYFFRGGAIEGCSVSESLANSGEIVIDHEIFHQVEESVMVEPVADHYRLAGFSGELPPAQELSIVSAMPDIQSRFFPADVIQQLHEGEFRQVVNMFISLPTVRTEAQLEIFMKTLFDMQDHFGGLLNRLDFGDKGSHLFLIWGAPIAHENDIERALNFILNLQMLTSIPISAGITYRTGLACFIGSSLREEYTCYGQGANLAARFMTSAHRGEIWVDEQVARRAYAQFEIEYKGTVSFKGFEEAQKVFLLSERKEQAEDLFSGKIVGRELELAQLDRFVSPLSGGRYAGALVILGEPGIGKSCLVHEFMATDLRGSKNIQWCYCQTDEILRESLNPVRYWLRSYFELSGSHLEARNKRIFNQKIDELVAGIEDNQIAAELDRTRSFLGALLNLSWPDSLYEQLDAQGRYENTFIGLTVLFQALSLLQPIVIVLEDAHWLDEDTRQFLPHLVRSVTSDESRSFPIAIIAAARPEGGIDLLGDGLAYQMLTLEKMSTNALSQLAEKKLGAAISTDLLAILTERAEGNPFFAEQILIYFMEENLLERKEDGWALRPGQLVPLPADVNAVLVARLDQLAQEVKDVIQTAAILGREFEVQLLVHMLKDKDDLPQKVAIAERAAIWIALDEYRYQFNHGLLWDAAYRMQVHARRQVLHAQAVEALESVYSSDLSTHYGELAYHAEKAALREKARNYLRMAGESALKAYQNVQALDYFNRALTLAPKDDLEARYNLHMNREKIYRLLGDQEMRSAEIEAIGHLLEAFEGTSEGPELDRRRAEMAERQASYRIDIGDYSEAITAAEEGVALASRAGALEVAVEAYNILSLGLLRTGNFEKAHHYADTGLEIARQNNDQQGESLLLNLLGLIAMEQGDQNAARSYLEQSLAFARGMGDIRVEARPLNSLGNLAASEGDYDKAQDYYQQVLEIARQIGNQRLEGVILVNLGWLAGIQGDYKAAQDYSRQVLRIARQVGDRQLEAYALINFSSWASGQEDYQAALAYAEQSLALNLETGDLSGESWSLTYLGLAHLGLNQLEEAASAYQAAVDIRRSLKQPTLATEPQAGLAMVALSKGDLPAAQAHVETILAQLEKGGTIDGTEEPLRVYLTCYRILLSAQDPRAEAILSAAYNMLQTRAAGIIDESKRRAFLEDISYHREILTAWLSHRAGMGGDK